MLDGKSSIVAHRAQDVALVLFSFVFLPLDIYITFLSYVFTFIFGSKVFRDRKKARSDPSFQRKTILITGVGMTKGLFLARLFYQAGHKVIGADFESGRLPKTCGRVSRSLSKFYGLSKPDASGDSTPYVRSLLDVVSRENVDLWVSCSGVASAVEDGEAKEILEARTSCKAIQFDVQTTQTLHEKHTFIERTQKVGLTIPETHTITSRKQVEEYLRDAPKGRKYIMKTIGVDDSVRGDMTLLPKPTQKETSEHIARLRINTKNPWILQQYIQGPEFCTHSLTIRGEVRAFVACPSAELLMHYSAIPAESPLSQAMLNFTKTYARSYGRTFTGHLSFDFLIENQDLQKQNPEEIILYPIECNPRAHTAVCLFKDTTSMISAYLSILDFIAINSTWIESSNTREIVTPIYTTKDKYYWIGHDIFEFIILPLFNLLTFQSSISQTITSLWTFMKHLLLWRDGTFEIWDPLPYLWLYHVFWPVRFLDAFIYGRKWSRVNVSTTKMFMC